MGTGVSLRHINSDVAKTSGIRHLPVPDVLRRYKWEDTLIRTSVLILFLRIQVICKADHDVVMAEVTP